MLCAVALRVGAADAPESLSATAERTSVTLKWPRVPEATWTNLYWRVGVDTVAPETKIVNATSPYLHESLTPGATYRYRLSAAYADTERDTGLTATVTLPPAAPTFVDAAGNDQSTTLQWDPVPGAAHYRIYWNTKGGVTATESALTAPAAPYVHKGLTPGGRYYYRVAAQNAGGEGELSREVSVQLTSEAPVINVITAGDGEITLSWAPVVAAETYTLYWNTAGAVSRADTKIQFVTSAFIHTELQRGGTYFYRLSATNRAGESELSAERTLTLPPAEPVVHLQADSDHATLEWLPLNGAETYHVYWDTHPGVSETSRKVSNARSPFIPDELKAGETYYYRVAAVNVGGETLSKELAAALRPQAPVLARAEKASRQITLHAPAVVGAQSYNLYWSLVDAAGSAEKKMVGITLPFTHHGLKNGATYSYRLAAANIAGESALSPALQVTLPPDAPVIADVSGADKRVELRWNALGPNVTYAIYWNTKGNVGVNDTRVTTSETNWNHEALNNGAKYYYRIAALNSGGEGELSQQATVTLAPDAPSAQAVASGEQQVTLTWPAVAGAVSYNVFWSSQTRISAPAVKIAQADSPYVHTGLQKGETYFYRVTALNEGGETLGQLVPVTLIPDIPQVPVAKSGDRQIALTWAGVPGATGYRVYWNTTGTVTARDAALDVTRSDINHPNLVNGGIYFYRVAAANSGGSSPLSAELKVTLAPDAPTIRELSGADHRATVHWSNVNGAVSYNVYWRKVGDTAPEARIIGATTPFVHAGIDNGLSYSYRVAAVNDGGETFSAPAAVTLLPDAPTMSLAVNGNQQATLQWGAVPGATTYTVYWNTTGKVSELDHPTDISASTYLHAGLVNGATYYYRLSARNAAGASGLSKETEVTLAPDAPLLETAQAVERSIALQWQPASGATAYRIYWNSTGNVTAGGVPFNVAEPRLSHPNLNRGATYYYRIAAVNAGGETLGQEFSVTLAPDVTVFASVAGGDKQAKLAWAVSSGATEYHIYWNNQGNVTTSDAMLKTSAFSFVHAPLKNGLKYFYRIAAANSGGESVLSAESVTTLAPDAPPIEQMLGEDKQVTLGWGAVPGAQQFTIYWKPADSKAPPAKVENAVSPRVFTGLRNGVKYAFTVSASNAGGEGFVSEHVVVTPHNRKLSGLFPDGALQQCVSSEATANGWNYADEVAGILVCNSVGIRTLAGAEWLENLSNLSVRGNRIVDLKPLSGLVGLNYLALDGNEIVDLNPLTSLGALNYLSLNNNPLRDLHPLADLKSLTSLYLNNTQVSDLEPLARLSGLIYLSASNSEIENVQPLSGLSNLARLHLGGNKIVDVLPLATLTRLSELDVSRNEVGGKGVGNVTSLLSLKGMQLLQIGRNNALSCSEATALINRLGSPPVDLDGIVTNFDAPIDGENCVAP